MCLYVNKHKTEQESQKPGLRIFYKLFIKESNHLKTPYFSFIVKEPGLITLNNPSKEKIMIGAGAFHARTSKTALNQDVFFSDFFERNKNGKHVHLPINVNHEDILAFGNQNDVAVKSYWITQKTWDTVFK